MSARRLGGQFLVAGLISAVLYLPVRRELLDFGLIPATTLHSQDGRSLTLWDDGRYRLNRSIGKYKIETFVNTPWISLIRLDSGMLLHSRYQDRIFRVEDLSVLDSQNAVFKRD